MGGYGLTCLGNFCCRTKNGQTNWRRIQYGAGTDQLHVDRIAAERIPDGITQALQELDEIERRGPTTEQRELAAWKIIASRHMAALPALPARTQQAVRNRLSELAAQTAQ